MKNLIIKIAICTWACLAFAFIPTKAQESNPDPTIWVNTWTSCTPSSNPVPGNGTSHWIQYDLGSVRRLSNTWIWNSNDPQTLNQGFKEVRIDYSIDGQIWTNWGKMSFPKGTGEAVYGGFPGPAMVDINARYVVLTALSNHGHPSCSGIAEVKFNLLPEKVGNSAYDNYACKDFAQSISHTVAGTTASINWSPAVGRDLYRVSYLKVGQTGPAQLVFSETNSIQLSELEPNAEYEYFIGVECLDEEIEWSEVRYFNTPLTTSENPLIPENPSLVKLAPNPSNGSFELIYHTHQRDQIHLSVIDIRGKEIYQTGRRIDQGLNVVSVNLPNQAHGIYFLRVFSEEQQQNQTVKLVVK